MGLDALFDRAASGGYRRINVTYPYSKRPAANVAIGDPLVRAVGAPNTPFRIAAQNRHARRAGMPRY